MSEYIERYWRVRMRLVEVGRFIGRHITDNTSGNRVAAKRLGVEIQVTGDFGSPIG